MFIIIFIIILRRYVLFTLLCVCCFSSGIFAETIPPDLLLAKVYPQNKHVNVKDYWISEKYDGVRAYWNGKVFLSRRGNIYHAPKWFIQDFPSQALDGELWLERNTFEKLLSIVKKKRLQPVDEIKWRSVKYMVFELPNAKGTFSQRLLKLQQIISTNKNPYLKLIPQFRLNTRVELMQKLQQLTKQGAEGLMLHRAEALYHTGRSRDLLKLKARQQGEAIVINHLAGKGKYQGMLGALLVKTTTGKKFRIGTGFSDAERANPPNIGLTIRYKHYGKTHKGIPRFASYLGIK